MPRTDEPQPVEDDGRSFRTGPNVDTGIEPGAVTVDPDTMQGVAARAAREANGATSEITEDGVEVVHQPDAPYGPKVDDGDHEKVLAYEEQTQQKQQKQTG